MVIDEESLCDGGGLTEHVYGRRGKWSDGPKWIAY